MVPLDPAPQSIDTLPARGAPGDTAVIGRERRISYGELEQRVAALAGWLAGQGLQPGDRVASWLSKTLEAVLMPLAAPRAGLVHVPVNPVLKPAQVAHILADSGARLLLTNPGRAESLGDGAPADCRMVTDAPATDATPLPPSGADADTLAAILYTSGSTGRAKGVMLSHANLWLGAISVAHYLALTPADVVLGVLPFSFDYGQNQLFSTWAAGAAVAPIDYATARDVVRGAARTGATTIAGVPPLWSQLLAEDWPAETAEAIRRLTNSGGALTPALTDALQQRFPKADLYPMYGLTEAFRSTYLPPALVATHPGSIGRAIPFAEVMVVRPDGSRAAAGEAGELVHAGPLVAQGYWRDPARTAERFRPAPAFARSGGTAVWSGDTVVENGDGLLRFVGRDDETIKSQGNRISPSEIEEAVLAGAEARAAVAVGVPDAWMGHAVAVALEGDAAGEPALRERLRRVLPGFMQPVRYDWHDALPHNANGKLARAAIRARLLATRPEVPDHAVVETAGAKPTGPLPPEFADQRGALTIGGRRFVEWIAEAGGRTPLFVYDMEVVRARVRQFRAAVPASLHYAVKANPFAPLLRAVAREVDGLDVASAGELTAARAVKPAAAISFAGPGKTDAELALALAEGVAIHLESEGEFDRVLALAERAGATPRLGVRVNPEVELRGSGLRMGGRASPFGIDADRAAALVRRVIAAGAEWRGFHVYAGSQSLDAGAIAEANRATLALAARLADEAGAMPPELNLGGGFGIPYFPGDVLLDVAAVGRALGDALAERSAALADTRFVMELGRWLVGEAGVYLARVLDRKVSRGETFLVVDGGMHHQLAASGNLGTVVRRNYPVAIAGAMGEPADDVATVVGCLCTPLDRLAERIALPHAVPGDVIAVFAAGAYGLTASPARFLSHPDATELLAPAALS